MWLGGTNYLVQKEEKKLPDTVMGRAPYALSFSRTCIAIFPEPLTAHLGKNQTYFKITNLHDNLESVPKLTTS
jgi:hypothetical protein